MKRPSFGVLSLLVVFVLFVSVPAYTNIVQEAAPQSPSFAVTIPAVSVSDPPSLGNGLTYHVSDGDTVVDAPKNQMGDTQYVDLVKQYTIPQPTPTNIALHQTATQYVNTQSDLWITNTKLKELTQLETQAQQEHQTLTHEAQQAQQEYETKTQESKEAYLTYARFKQTLPKTVINPGIDAILATTGKTKNPDEYLNKLNANTLLNNKLHNLHTQAINTARQADILKTIAQTKTFTAQQKLTQIQETQHQTQTLQTTLQTQYTQTEQAWTTLWELTVKTSPHPAQDRNQAITYAVTKKWNQQLHTLPQTEQTSNQIRPAHQTLISLNNPNPQPQEPSCHTYTSQTLLNQTLTPQQLYSPQHSTPTPLAEYTHPGNIIFNTDPLAGIHQTGITIIPGYYATTNPHQPKPHLNELNNNLYAIHTPNTQPPQTGTATPSPYPPTLPGALPWDCGTLTTTNTQNNTQTTTIWHEPIPHTTVKHLPQPDWNNLPNPDTVIHLTTLNPSDSTQTAVENSYDGIVTKTTFADPQYGNSVHILTENNITVIYSNLNTLTTKVGDEIKATQPVGTLGTTIPNPQNTVPSTIIHMLVNQTPINPQNVLYPITKNNYQNGQIPIEDLCQVQGGKGRLRCDAAGAFELLANAYREHFGTNIHLTDTYRDLAGQIRCRANKGHWCATPGTSNHGWGLAIDFGGGINSFGTPQHEWMRTNAQKYGWYHPSWAQADGSKPEPWHWEYIATMKKQ